MAAEAVLRAAAARDVGRVIESGRLALSGVRPLDATTGGFVRAALILALVADDRA